jgi:hypothetical protein
MVRRGAGVVQRQRFENKAALLAAGSAAAALTYERASQDRKGPHRGGDLRRQTRYGRGGRAGPPHGKLTYGYRRVYDPRTKAFLRQECR